MPALHELPATGLVAGYRRREFSPVEVTRAVLAHIERWEPHLQALFLLRPTGPSTRRAPARRAGCAASRSAPSMACRSRSRTTSPPPAIPTPLGTAAVELAPALADSPPAARVKESGGVVVAKTTMPDYGMLSSGLSSYHALARNPWDSSKTPGGSSAGAGAAAAAGYGPLHVGTDIGGSLRLPAGWCGIFTLKPSLGRIPIDPPYTGRAAGPMTRSVADAALFMQVLARPDPRDSMGLPFAGHRVAPKPTRAPSGCAACASACCWKPAAAWPCCPRCAPPSSMRRASSSAPAPACCRCSRS
jgi:aspartyl-tRNA(Asn)/glutamyl-tRNA(Gln) amidotransferase subunit A